MRHHFCGVLRCLIVSLCVLLLMVSHGVLYCLICCLIWCLVASLLIPSQLVALNYVLYVLQPNSVSIKFVMYVCSSLVLRPFLPPVFDHLQYANT